MENPGRWWGEVLSEIPSVMEYGYFLELHNNIYVFFTLSFLDYRKHQFQTVYILYIASLKKHTYWVDDLSGYPLASESHPSLPQNSQV